MMNFYKTLGVDDFAPAAEIKTAYRKLSKKFHPDVNDGDEFFEARFKEIQKAYEILGNSNRRKRHDASLRYQQLMEEQINTNRKGAGVTGETGIKNDPSFLTPFNIFILIFALLAFIFLFRYKAG